MNLSNKLRGTCGILLFITLSTFLFLWLFPKLPECYADLSDDLSAGTVHILLVVIILAIGFAFHLLHKINLLLYAVMEISFAVASSWHAVDYLMHNEGLISSVPALAAMYIFVRGWPTCRKRATPAALRAIISAGYRNSLYKQAKA